MGFAAASVAWNEQEANQELIQGRAAMFVGWWWMASRMLDAELPEVADNAAFAPAPGWAGGDIASYGYLWPVGILAQSDDLEASLEYMKWLTHPITERRIVLDETSGLNTNVAVRLSILADEEVNEAHGGLQGIASEVLATARTIPLIPQYTEIVPILAETINEIAIDANADIQAILDLAAEDVRYVMGIRRLLRQLSRSASVRRDSYDNVLAASQPRPATPSPIHRGRGALSRSNK